MNSMLEYKGYHASIEFDADDNLFVGEVFGISDSLNFHGASVEELRTMFEQSIDNYLQLCEQIGKEPDKEFKGTFNVRISPLLHKRAALEAVKEKTTLNQYVARAIENYVNRGEESGKETIIYIPYDMRKIRWETDKPNTSLYNQAFILPKKESISYVGN